MSYGPIKEASRLPGLPRRQVPACGAARQVYGFFLAWRIRPCSAADDKPGHHVAEVAGAGPGFSLSCSSLCTALPWVGDLAFLSVMFSCIKHSDYPAPGGIKGQGKITGGTQGALGLASWWLSQEGWMGTGALVTLPLKTVASISEILGCPLDLPGLRVSGMRELSPQGPHAGTR